MVAVQTPSIINDTVPEVMVIQDFNVGGVRDVLNFSGTSLHSFADVQAASFYSPGINTTIVTDAAGSAAWLIGLAPGQLDAGMFRFSCRPRRSSSREEKNNPDHLVVKA